MTTYAMSAEGEITRVEVAEAVGEAFTMGSVTRATLLETARRTGARDEVLAVLGSLPGREFNDLRQLWAELPEMPVR